MTPYDLDARALRTLCTRSGQRVDSTGVVAAGAAEDETQDCANAGNDAGSKSVKTAKGIGRTSASPELIRYAGTSVRAL